MIKDVKTATTRSYEAICAQMRLSYSNFCRYRQRIERGERVIEAPGPKKIEPFNPNDLNDGIKALGHRNKRSFGTERLYRLFAPSISRRDLKEMVNEARAEIKRDKRNNMKRIEWIYPNIAWSMDDTELGKDKNGEKIYVHTLQDLASRYKFPPITGEIPDGEAVAGHLEKNFRDFGLPLFLKMDNAGNLNENSTVGTALIEHFVIPLNSPTYYPLYNGAVEKAQREIKVKIWEKLTPYGLNGNEKHMDAYAEAAIHDINHKPRGSLKGENACTAFFAKKSRYNFTKPERRFIYDWLKEKQYDILKEMDKDNPKIRQTAWRIGVETWLRKMGFIFVKKNGKVLPYF